MEIGCPFTPDVNGHLISSDSGHQFPMRSREFGSVGVNLQMRRRVSTRRRILALGEVAQPSDLARMDTKSVWLPVSGYGGGRETRSTHGCTGDSRSRLRHTRILTTDRRAWFHRTATTGRSCQSGCEEQADQDPHQRLGQPGHPQGRQEAAG